MYVYVLFDVVSVIKLLNGSWLIYLLSCKIRGSILFTF